MIRHARRDRLLPAPIFPLPIAMIESPFLAALVPAIRAPPLVEPGLVAALLAAVAVATVTMRADEKDRVAMFLAARTLQEISVVMSYRRHRRPAGRQRQPSYVRLEPVLCG